MAFQLCSVSHCLFHQRVRLVKSVQSINHLVCLESPRRYVEMQMLRLVMGQLGLSLDDETLQFWRKRLFERDVTCIPRKSLSKPSSFGTRLLLPVFRALPPDTIESDDELHR